MFVAAIFLLRFVPTFVSALVFAGVAAAPISNPACGFVAGCYLLLNDQDPVYAAPFELNIKRVAVEVTVLTRRTGGAGRRARRMPSKSSSTVAA